MWFKQSFTANRAVLTYITVGALTVVWAGVWYVYLFNNPAQTHNAEYWCTGFLVTGLTLILIGLGLGRVGRSVQPSDLPAEGVPLTVANAQPNGTAPALMLVARDPSAPVVAANGQVAAAPLQSK
jgi:hypothetical protein